MTDDNFYSVSKEALSKTEFELCFLPDHISKKLNKIAIKGDAFFDEEDYLGAIQEYEKGIELVPKPKEEYEAMLWFVVAIADAYWHLKNYQKALIYLDQCLIRWQLYLQVACILFDFSLVLGLKNIEQSFDSHGSTNSWNLVLAEHANEIVIPSTSRNRT